MTGVKNCVRGPDALVVRCETLASTTTYPQYRYFVLWNTAAFTPSGLPVVPDGSYQLQILTALRRDATYQRDLEKATGERVRSPYYAEATLNNLANDNYGHWPGVYAKRLTVDNVPRLRPSTWVGDFNPNAPTEAGRTIHIRANVTEPAAAQGEIVWPDGRVTNLTEAAAATCARNRVVSSGKLNLACPSANFGSPPNFGATSGTDEIRLSVVMPLGAPAGQYRLRLFLTDNGHDAEARAGVFRSGLIERGIWADTAPPVAAVENVPAWTNIRNGPLLSDAELEGIQRGLLRGDYVAGDPELLINGRIAAQYQRFLVAKQRPDTLESRELFKSTVAVLNVTLTADQSLQCEARACGAPMRVWIVDMVERDGKTDPVQTRFMLRCPQHCIGKGQEASAFLRVAAFHERSYAFNVTAIDNAGNVQSPASPTVETRIDTLPGQSSVVNLPYGRTRIGNDTTHTVEILHLPDPHFGAWETPRFSHVLFNVSKPGEEPGNWTPLPRPFVTPASSDGKFYRATFAGKVLASPGYGLIEPAMLAEGNLVHLLVLTVDDAGNLEGEAFGNLTNKTVFRTPYGNVTREPHPPLPLDITPPVLLATPRVEVSASRVDLEWAFNENATGVLEWGTLAETERGVFPNAVTPSREEGITRIERANVTNLEQNTTYGYRIVATDEVGNRGVLGPFLFTTEAVLALVVTSPEPESTWTKTLRIGWAADAVKVPVGKRKDAVSYNFTLILNERTHDPYYLGIAGPFSEAESGNALHIRTFEFQDRDVTGRVIPDARRAYVRVCGEGTLNKGAPICANSAAFAIDNTPPTTRATLVGPHVGSWYRSIVDVLLTPEGGVTSARVVKFPKVVAVLPRTSVTSMRTT